MVSESTASTTRPVNQSVACVSGNARPVRTIAAITSPGDPLKAAFVIATIPTRITTIHTAHTQKLHWSMAADQSRLDVLNWNACHTLAPAMTAFAARVSAVPSITAHTSQVCPQPHSYLSSLPACLRAAWFEDALEHTDTSPPERGTLL